MNWADWAIVAIIAISCLMSIVRGFVREAISLAIWIAAFFISVAFYERLAVLLQHSIESASLRTIISFGALFIATLIVGAMVKHLTSEFVKMTGLSGADRLLGIAFGLARGIIIIMALLIFVPMAVPVNGDLWWSQSLLIPEFLLMEQWSRDTFETVVGWFRELGIP